MHHKKHEHMHGMHHEGRTNGFGAGISRVMQRGHDKMDKGQGGKMSATKGVSEAHWKRGDSLTPRKA